MTAAVVDPIQTREPNLICKEFIAARTLILAASGALAGRLISTISTPAGAIFGATAAIASSAAAIFIDKMQMKSSACKTAYFVASLFATFGAAHLALNAMGFSSTLMQSASLFAASHLIAIAVATSLVTIASTAYAIILQTKSEG